VEELLQSKKELILRKHLKKLSKYDAIILDDLGYVRKSREEMDVLFSFFSERYERGSVMITSNLPFSKWDIIFKDPMITAAAIDRLVHHSVILELNLESYRMEQAKKRNRIKSDKKQN
jgi:DNA replication protein DnaC